MFIISFGVYFIFFNKSVDTYDIDKEGIPKFIDSHFIDLDKIEYIKRFRTYGSDSSDDFESCRSMNNCFLAFEEFKKPNEVEVYSPITGEITNIVQTWVNSSGQWGIQTKDYLTKVTIRYSENPAFLIKITFVDIRSTNLKVGMQVLEGQKLGYVNMDVIGTSIPESLSCIQIIVHTPSGVRYLSYFECMTDNLFEDFIDRGSSSRDDFIISKEERDADPLTCVYKTTLDSYGVKWIYEKGNIPSWVYLGKNPEEFEIVYDYTLK